MAWWRRKATRTDDAAAPADPPRRRIRPRLVGLAIVALLAGTSPLWAPLLMRRMDFFRVRRVELRGAVFLAAADVVGRMRLDTTRSVWDPLDDIERQVAAHPQVRSVRVDRALPGTIVIEIDERLPVALVPTPTGFRAHDERGVPLPIDLSAVTVDAPIVPVADTTIFRLLAELRQRMPALYDRLSEARRAGRDELVLQLETVPIRTMRTVSLDRLQDIAPVERDLARRQLVPAEIDLRFRDQVIARLP